MAIYINGRLVAGGGSGTGGGSSLLNHGIPSGGKIGQVLAKKSGADYDTQWIDAGTGGASGGGFVEMETSIPSSDRVDNTLYGLILETYD